jgi:hypothetical protein
MAKTPFMERIVRMALRKASTDHDSSPLQALRIRLITSFPADRTISSSSRTPPPRFADDKAFLDKCVNRLQLAIKPFPRIVASARSHYARSRSVQIILSV